jgi:phosphoribosylanthranilate isomerase
MTMRRSIRTRVKVCGLTRASDARAAVLAGADALGVILVPGARRAVTHVEAAAVFAEASPFVTRVGVFVDPSLDDVLQAVDRLGLQAVQLSGSEGPDLCAQVPLPVIKAFHVGSGFDVSAVARYGDVIAAALLDTAVAGEHGGTGQTFHWTQITDLPEGLPIVLAGGLHPGNVGEAIAAIRPYAVDVSSGVEAAVREKDPARIEAFFAAVRAADAAGAGLTKDE